MMDLDARFARDQVEFLDGQAVLAGRSGDGAVPASDIRDADPDAAPPEFRTLTGITLFISATQRADLLEFCVRNQIPRNQRADVWGDLLEPFLDTEFTSERQKATYERLTSAGLAAEEIERIRKRVGPLMIAYNSLHWDWAHLGLCDLIDAATAHWIPESVRDQLGDITEFYDWAMRIAELPPPSNR